MFASFKLQVHVISLTLLWSSSIYETTVPSSICLSGLFDGRQVKYGASKLKTNYEQLRYLLK